MMKQKNQKSKDKKIKIKTIQGKTTALALSILCAISFGVMGFEIYKSKTDSLIQTSDQSRHLKDLNTSSTSRLSTNFKQYLDSKNTNVDTLKEINLFHTKKIQELKRKLNETTVNLYDIKSHLFAKSNPQEHHRLAELSNELIEKEEQNEQFLQKITKLLDENNELSIKVSRFENAIDKMNVENVNQKTSSDQIVTDLKNSIANLQESLNDNKNSIEIISLSKKNLEDELDQNRSTISHLEEAIQKQQNTLTKKDEDLNSQKILLKDLESKFENEFEKIKHSLENEISKNEELVSILDKETNKSLKQSEQKHTLEKQLEENNAKNTKDLSQLEQSLEKTLKEYSELQESISDYVIANDLLKEEKASIIEEKDKQEAYFKVLVSNLEDSLSQIQIDEKIHLALDEDLKRLQDEMYQLEQENQNNQITLKINEEEIKKTELHNRLLKEESEKTITALQQTIEHMDEQNISREESLTLANNELQQEKNRLKDLKDSLKSEQEAKEAEQQISQKLRETLKEKTEEASNLEKQLVDNNTLEQTIASLNSQINESINHALTSSDEIESLTNELNTKTLKYEQLEKNFHELTKKAEIDNAYLLKLQEEADQNNTSIDSLTIQLENLNKEAVRQSEYIQLVEKNNQNQLTQIEGLKENLDRAEKAYDTISLNFESLKNNDKENIQTRFNQEEEIKLKNKTISHLEEEYDSLQNSLTSKKNEIFDLNGQLTTLKNESLQDKNLLNCLKDEQALTVHNLSNMQDELYLKNACIDNLYHEIAEKQNLVSTLKDQMINHQTQFNDLENLYNETLDSKSVLESEVLCMSETFNKQQSLVNNLNQKIHVISQKIELEECRAKAFENANKKELEYVTSLERKLENSLFKIAELENLINDQLTTDYQFENTHEIALSQHSKKQEQQVKNINSSLEHTVKKGENLSIISTYYYGTPDRWNEIYELNKSEIKDKNRLITGTVLIIPE